MPNLLYGLDSSLPGGQQVIDRGAIVSVDFGDAGSDTASTVVESKQWVTAQTRFECGIVGVTDDHPSIEDALLEGIRVAVGEVIPGTGYTVVAFAPNGPVTGSFNVHVVGV